MVGDAPPVRETALILDAGDVAAAARGIREMGDAALADMGPSVLRRAASLLRQGAYSATVAARRLDGLAKTRERAL